MIIVGESEGKIESVCKKGVPRRAVYIQLQCFWIAETFKMSQRIFAFEDRDNINLPCVRAEVCLGGS